MTKEKRPVSDTARSLLFLELGELARRQALPRLNCLFEGGPLQATLTGIWMILRNCLESTQLSLSDGKLSTAFNGPSDLDS